MTLNKRKGLDSNNSLHFLDCPTLAGDANPCLCVEIARALLGNRIRRGKP